MCMMQKNSEKCKMDSSIHTVTLRVWHDLVNVLGFVIHADAIAHSLAISAFFSGEDQVAPHGNGETAYYPIAYPIPSF